MFSREKAIDLVRTESRCKKAYTCVLASSVIGVCLYMMITYGRRLESAVIW